MEEVIGNGQIAPTNQEMVGDEVNQQTRSIDDIITECREFIRLKNLNARERCPDVGKPMYLVSKAWLRRYKDYILHTDIKRNNKP